MTPLAEKLRPKSLEEWVGHSDVMSSGKPVYEAIKNDRLFSFVLYAPPGTGKTTLCQLVKKYTKDRFISLSAVTSGVKDLKAVIEEAKAWKDRQDRNTVVFIDEIHRFNKSQQDALLNAVENGTIVLIGATTENPSYELNSALISRLRVFRLAPLTEEDLMNILRRASRMEEISIDENLLKIISKQSQGDARMALGIFEILAPEPTEKRLREIIQSKIIYYDKAGEEHYQVISAFIKSMRASQVDAAMYYLARMWAGGEDPLFIARRMVIFASEDIGNADIRALALANAVKNAVEFVGRPECYYALAQGVMFLARAPKSREAGDAFQKALKKVEAKGPRPVPNFLINAVSKLDRELGRGEPRDDNQSYLPKGICEETADL
ncbi:MAG: family ATPase [Bacteriovoracaceae bacterium]|nr:family ATPase [Bacteriovoracaceae bacterium]